MLSYKKTILIDLGEISETPFFIGRSQENNLVISDDKKIAWGVIKQEDLKKRNLNLSALAGFNNFLSEISEIDISILFYETETGKTKISLRSKKSDVNKLAAHFGGGGHKNAAGISTTKPLEIIEKELIELIQCESKHLA